MNDRLGWIFVELGDWLWCWVPDDAYDYATCRPTRLSWRLLDRMASASYDLGSWFYGKAAE